MNLTLADRMYALWQSNNDSAENRIQLLPKMSSTQIDALQQLAQPVWDGNLMSKQARTELVNMGLVSRWNGLNFATKDGYVVLDTLKLLGDTSKFGGWSGHERS